MSSKRSASNKSNRPAPRSKKPNRSASNSNKSNRSASRPNKPNRQTSSSKPNDTKSPEKKWRSKTNETTTPGGPTRILSKRELMLAAGVGLCAILGALAAFVISSSSPDIWESRAELEYRGGSFVETAAISAASRTDIVRVAETFDLPVDDVEEQFIVFQPPNTEILELRYRDEDQDRTLEVLGALSDVVVERSTNSALTTQIALVQTELDRLEAALASEQQSVAALDAADPGSAAVTAGIEQVVVLSSQIADLELRLVDLELRKIDESPVVVTEPYVLSEPVGPSPLRNALLGALLGLGAAIAAVVAFGKLR